MQKLDVGTRLAHYRITAAIGAGGMGEVFRANDTKLGRDVAIKLLLPDGADDPERLARFDREARLLASLNHPNVASIYALEDGLGEAGPHSRALVMELVEGPTLADRIAGGRLEAGEALGIARQVAEALAAAHAKGIVHRDLKPANVKVRPDGTVKVLDFGLAKAIEPVASASASSTSSPTFASPAMTQAGMILGTAAYMAPEQARGAAVDKRADIWAFGVVLFEMLTGKRLFEGETVSAGEVSGGGAGRARLSAVRGMMPLSWHFRKRSLWRKAAGSAEPAACSRMLKTWRQPVQQNS